MSKRALHVVSNISPYDDPSHPTGLWLSELTHALGWPLLDASARAWLADKARSALLASTARPDDIDAADYNAIYFTGGHAVMWDFPNSAGHFVGSLATTSAAGSRQPGSRCEQSPLARQPCENQLGKL